MLWMLRGGAARYDLAQWHGTGSARESLSLALKSRPKGERAEVAMDFDPVLLARLQFAFTIIFHIIFPSFTIGLSAYIATLGAMWLRTGEDRYHRLMRFWTKIFAVSFAMGVVSGIVLSYQFGTNWSRFSVFAGNVLGPLLGYEVLAAFFLEATFLGVMLFGFNRVSAVVVAAGTAILAFWILAANSWMQTPAGYALKDGVAVPTDWLAVIFNPSSPIASRTCSMPPISPPASWCWRWERAF
jgi:cytochrome d ubiquinol oxidase subunit I